MSSSNDHHQLSNSDTGGGGSDQEHHNTRHRKLLRHKVALPDTETEMEVRVKSHIIILSPG